MNKRPAGRLRRVYPSLTPPVATNPTTSSASAASPTDALPDDLVYVEPSTSGYTARRLKRGWGIYDEGGGRIQDAALLARVDALGIPPQWREVWVCADPAGHLQCTGRDAKDRKQYIYHAEYVAFRQNAKFRKLVGFAERLPAARREVARQLRRRTWDRERMLALMFRLLDRTHLRIGNDRYSAENETYGLTTLRRRHVRQDEGRDLRISFTGKSGKLRRVTVKNRQLRRLVREVSELPGYRLFTYRDERGKARELDSGDLNDYLHDLMGDRFSAKDFRTWGGTSDAVRLYPAAVEEHERAGRGKLVTRLVRLVAKELGNTVSVCRSYYIHPEVLAGAERGGLPSETWEPHPRAEELAPYEAYTLEFLRGRPA